MSKPGHAVHFEWAFAEEGAFWPEAELLLPAPEAPAARHQSSPYRLPAPFAHTLALVLLTLLTTASVPFARQGEQARLQRQLEAALQREEEIWQQNDITRFRHWLDPLAAAEWRSDWSTSWGIQPDQRTTLGTRITSIEPQEEVVLVQTQVNQPLIAWWYTTPFRELRFYRQTPNGWMRTSPQPAAWGPQRTVATPHFRFQFYERDTATILPLSTQVELAYLQLYQLLGHAPPARTIDLRFEVVPDQMREFRVHEEPLRFASPLLLKAPAGMTDVEYTTHLVISHLADRALLELLGVGRDRNSRQFVSRWRTMFWGASGHLRTAVLGKRSPWQQEAELFFRQTDWNGRPLHLTAIDDRYTGLSVPREGYLWEYMAAESLIAYVVDVYGWEGVSALFRGFGQSSYWSKVIPNVFHQSAADLESGWNRYLVTTYSATPLRSLSAYPH